MKTHVDNTAEYVIIPTDGGDHELAAGLKSLQVLGLHGTQVTDEGVAQLRKIHRNLVIVGRK